MGAHLHPRNIPVMSNRTNAPTPHWAGTATMGRNSRLTSASGYPSAVSVTAAYIAPEAPREGKISGRPNALFIGAALAAAVVAAALDVESCDRRRGNIIRVAAIWETRPEKRPADE